MPQVGVLNHLMRKRLSGTKGAVTSLGRWKFYVVAVIGFQVLQALAQIDPVPRQLIQFGYNAALEGNPPISAYAYYYWNHPGFYRTNLTLRVAFAPTYLDSELGIAH